MNMQIITFSFFFFNQDNNILIYWRKSDVNIIKVENRAGYKKKIKSMKLILMINM